MALVLHIPKRQVRLVAAAAVVAVMGAGVAARALPADPAALNPEVVLPAPHLAAPAVDPLPAGTAAAQDPAQQGEPQQGVPAQQPGVAPPPAAAQQELLTPEERAALALVEQIIRDQEGVLMGTGFSYNPVGRRDPFRSLIVIDGPRREDDDSPRPQGLAGFLISEVDLKAIATAQGRWHAMVTGPNQKAYFLEVGTELYDGHVADIRPGEVVFSQEVRDALNVLRVREVTKQLTTNSGGGQTP